MSSLAALRYPSTRTLLPRTRLAYVHLRNLLTDAKRDRAARVSGYVLISLPEETLTLYLRGGELINATTRDGRGVQAVAIAGALGKIPSEPEYGEICFHEAEEEMLADMFVTQTTAEVAWPDGLMVTKPSALFPYLMSTTFDGVVEIIADDAVNYLSFRHGSVAHAFFAGSHPGTVIDRVAKLFSREGRTGELRVSRWNPLATLPAQAPPPLIQAYRELASGLVQRLVDHGRESAPAIAEHARLNLVGSYPILDGLSFSGRTVRDPVADAETLTAGVAAWIRDFVWAAVDQDAVSPETLLRALTWDRRHLFQSAGLYDQIPWKVL